MTRLSRRDILKLSAASLGGVALAAASNSRARKARAPDAGRPNILILVFDTLSAPHMSLYGYGRSTTPNLDRFAQGATVYHAHHSTANYTTPGTASLLTGLDVWHHRALSPSAPVTRRLATNNIFHAAGKEYVRIAFTQNLMAEIFLRQFHEDIDIHLPPQAFAYRNPLLLGEMDLDDPLISLAFDDFLVGGFKFDTPYPGSVTLGALDRVLSRGAAIHPDLHPDRRTDTSYNGYFFYKNRIVFDGMVQTLQKVAAKQASPYLAYFHLWSPHEPYSPAREFSGLFNENIKVPLKPDHPLAYAPLFKPLELYEYRRVYDQYVANVDAEFGRMMSAMSDSGMLDDTCVIVLSDHGQLFERGVHGHASRLLHQPVLRVPLLIHMPGQEERLDIYEPTGNVDLLPTLASIMRLETSMQSDGRLLPGFGGEAQAGRPLFATRGLEDPARGPLKIGTFVLVKDRRKLQLFTGYEGLDEVMELYDLEADPNELRDLSRDDPATARRMKEELLTARDAADRAASRPSGQ